MKHDNLSRFDEAQQEEYLWREIDRVKINKSREEHEGIELNI